MLIAIILISVLIFAIIIYLIITNVKTNKLKSKIIQTKSYKKLSEYINMTLKRNLVSRKKSILNPAFLIIIMLGVFIVFFVLFYSYIKVLSTAIILSLPFLFSPVILFRILLNR